MIARADSPATTPVRTEPPSVGTAARQLRPDEFSAAVAAVTTAFGDPTRREIYLHAGSCADGVTASTVAREFHLHTNVARHHLDRLAAGGYLEVQVGTPGGGAGRPSKRYLVTAKAAGLEFPGQRDDLILRLLGRTLAELPPDRAKRIAEEVGLEYGTHLAEQMAPGDAHRSREAGLRAVADALTAHGFAAHAEARGGSLRIISEHCPFGDTAMEHPVICAVDRGLVQGMLGHLCGEGRPELAEWRGAGDDVCVTGI